MFSLRVDQVRSGMILAKPVFNLNGTKLLEKNYTLDKNMIARLENAGAKRLWVTDDSNSFLKDFVPQKIFHETVKVLEDVKVRVTDGKSFDAYTVNEVTHELVEQIIANEMPFAEMVRMKLTENSVSEHMVDVSMLSIMTGKAMGMDKLDMRFLGFAALLHDVGKIFVPAEILAKPAKLNESEMRVVKKHPQIGFDILSNIEGINKHTLSVVLQHHERLDGSGYPFGLQGKSIKLFSRIVAISDIYTAVIREKSYRPRIPIYEAGELLWSDAGAKLDRKLTSTFLRHVVTFPLRSTVKLNNGAVGKVVYQNSDFPTRPIVSVDGEMTDLSESTTLFVSELLAYEYD
ncbi:MAG: HD-GYP domain-containing protein [Eubacteriales bacterium]